MAKPGPVIPAIHKATVPGDSRRLLTLAAVLICFPRTAKAAAAPDVKTFTPAGVQTVVVETDAGAIELTAGDDRTLSAEAAPAAAGDDCRIVRERHGETVTLTAHAPAKAWFGAAAKSCSAGFKVSAPAGVEITARSGSGKIDVGAFKGKADVRAGSGAIELHGAAGDLTLRGGSGTISGDAGGQRLIDVATGSGGIDLRELTGSLKARSGSGFVSLLYSAVPQAGDIDVRTGSGNLAAILPASARLMIDFQSGSGRLDSEFGSDTRSPLRLTFHSGSGGAALKKKI